MSIELTTRTDGEINAPGINQAFSDTSWDMSAGPPRKVSLSWQLLSDTQFSIEGSFHPLFGDPVSIQSAPLALSQLPNKVRISVGYGSAVNRGGLAESFSVRTADPAEIIPLSALPGSSRHELVNTGPSSFSLRFSGGPSPLDCGVQLLGETSTDLSSWSPFTPDWSEVPGEPGSLDYSLPDLDGARRFYRFAMAP
jgi:hypothetical protein